MRIVQEPETQEPKTRPKAAPKQTAPGTSAEDLKRPHTADEKKLAEAIGSGYQAIGGGLTMIGMRLGDEGLSSSGVKTMEMAAPLADAWIDLSRRNPTVKQWLRKVTEVSAVGMVVGLHIGCALPFLASRGILPQPAATDDEAAAAEAAAAFAAAMNGTK